MPDRHCELPLFDLTENERAVGLAGEIFVGKWLRQRFGLPPEVTWVSGYRIDILGHGKGSDSNGYDFEAVRPAGRSCSRSRRRPDPTASSRCTSPRSAQPNPWSRTRRLVNHALDPGQRTLTPLPNPLGRDGLNSLRVLGSALRLQFERAD